MSSGSSGGGTLSSTGSSSSAPIIRRSWLTISCRLLRSNITSLAAPSKTLSKTSLLSLMPVRIRSSILHLLIRLMTLTHCDCWPIRLTRPIRWLSLAGFQGSSKLMTLSAACRLRPVPPASVDRKTLQSGLFVNSSIRACRFFTGTLPESSTKEIPARDRWLPIRKVMVVHSLKITTLRWFWITSSSRIDSSSCSLGEILVSRSIRWVESQTWRILSSSIWMRCTSMGVRNFLLSRGSRDRAKPAWISACSWCRSTK